MMLKTVRKRNKDGDEKTVGYVVTESGLVEDEGGDNRRPQGKVPGTFWKGSGNELGVTRGKRVEKRQFFGWLAWGWHWDRHRNWWH